MISILGLQERLSTPLRGIEKIIMPIKQRVEKRDPSDIISPQIYTYIILAASILYWGATLYFAVSRPMPLERFGIAFLGGSFIMYLLFEGKEAIEEDKFGDFLFIHLLMIGVLITIPYFFIEYSDLMHARIGWATTTDQYFAIAILAITMYITYRSFGLTFLVILIGAIIYGYFGQWFPGVLSHTGLSFDRILETTVLEIRSGIFGDLTRIMASWIALFLLYAGLMRGYGAFDLILQAAVSTTKYIKSGVAQSAVLGSMIIGSINGSAAANTGISGSITIPLMKRNGMSAESAGATESVASTGGQIIPPVMGAAAFLMASLLARPFHEIIVAGILPALIFYLSAFIAVHFRASREINTDETQTSLDNPLTKGDLMIEGLRFFIPFAALIYLLAVLQFTVMTAALITVGLTFATGITFPLLRKFSLSSFKQVLIETGEGLKYGAKIAAPIAIVIGAINAVVDIFVTTGMPGRLSLALMSLSGGVLIITVILAMVVSVVLGLGMPTVAAYLLVATLIVPTFTGEFGVPSLAAHFFAFYGAILANITPPIAVAVVIATGISEGDFWRTADRAVRIGAPLFLLPIVFIYNPEIVTGFLDSEISTFEVLSSFGLALFGSGVVVYGLNRPYKRFKRYKSMIFQTLFVIFGIGAMSHPDYIHRSVFVILTFALYTVLLWDKRKRVSQETPS